MYVRAAVKAVLEQCAGYALVEMTLMQQVNLSLEPPASPREIRVELETLRKKDRVDYEVDEEDHAIRKWKIVSRK